MRADGRGIRSSPLARQRAGAAQLGHWRCEAVHRLWLWGHLRQGRAPPTLLVPNTAGVASDRLPGELAAHGCERWRPRGRGGCRRTAAALADPEPAVRPGTLVSSAVTQADDAG